MASWDRLSNKALARTQDRLVRDQVRHAVVPFSPYWKARFAELGRAADSVGGVTGLAGIPAVGERDVSPAGDPAGMAGLVLHATERGFALHAPGPTLRRALGLRLFRRDAYRHVVATETRATSYTWTGLGFRFPLASTRGDLDVIARAGARLFAVLGLTHADSLLSAAPVGESTEHVALSLAALAAGVPATFPGDDVAAVVAAAELMPPTVLAVPSWAATEVLEALGEGGTLDRLRTVLLVGAPAEREREAAREALGDRADSVALLAVHAPSGARVLWGECREAGSQGGLHTYPDLDVVQLVDPESGEHTSDAGEIVITQLGMRGSALLRWRTGDLADAPVSVGPCRGCGRTVPRVTGVRRGALVLTGDDGRTLDLRSVAGALTGRTDVGDWRIVVGRRARDKRGQVVVHLGTSRDAGDVALAAAEDIRTLAGLLPTQIVAGDGSDLVDITGEPLTRRIVFRRSTSSR